tara:strand:+ start:306 stop:1007 length:702 start_codon:yes stop_codon:yes gene_type:complete
MKLDLLVFGAHPDDVELACGGTIIKHTQKGKKVGVIDLTMGELGTRGNAELRLQEAQHASIILGLSLRENMGFKDGFFQDSEENKISLIKKIRSYKPDIVITNSPLDRHPDHGRSHTIVTEACFLSGLEKIETNQKPWRPTSIYHYIQFDNLKPDFIIDISKQIDLKLDAVKSYRSQFYNPKSKETKTIISEKGFLESVTYRAKDLGRLSNCDYAEGFLTHRIPSIEFLTDIK